MDDDTTLEPDEKLIEMLNDLLDMAEQGHLRELAWAAVLEPGTKVCAAWHSNPENYNMTHAVAGLHAKFMKEVLTRSENE